MKRLVGILPFVVFAVGAWIIVSAVVKHRETKRETVSEDTKSVPAVAPDAETFSPQDRELVGQVFDEPELLDSRPVPAIPLVAIHDEDGRPAMMSAQTQGVDKEMDGAEPVQEQPLLIESFASLRTDAVRNPESEQNQATVKKIMGMRQRRVAELGMD